MSGSRVMTNPVKTFLLVAMLSVGSGLAVRFALHRHHEPAHETIVTPPTPRPTPPEPPPTPPPEPPPTPVTPPPPAPPRIAGAKQISDATVRGFAATTGVIYYCDGTNVMAQPKSGGVAQSVGDCDGAFDFIADAQGVFYCNQHTLMRITAGTEGSHAVADVDCIMEALDAKYAYFVVPGFEGAVNPGVYRVVRAGGTPERIYSKSAKEQFMVSVDSEAVWIAAYGAGTIAKLAKTPGASAKELVSGQPGIVTFAIDPTYLYWHTETTTEVRRRKRTGGAIEVVGHDVSQEPVTTSDGHAYWFEGPPDDAKLVHLVLGALRVDTVASGLHTPSLRVDSEGAYVTELDQPGVFMFPR